MTPTVLSRFFADPVFARLARNVAYLFSANIAVALIGLVTLAVTARALGPAGFGALALIEAFVRSFNRLLQFESWQAVVRYGAQKLEAGEDEDFGRLVKFGTLIDVGGAVLSSVIACLGAVWLGPLVGLEGNLATMAAVAALMLLASIQSTPTAVLRLFNRFGLLSRLAVLFAVLRLGFFVIAWAAGGQLWGFVLALMASVALEGLVPLHAAWRELYRRGYRHILRHPLTGVREQNADIVRFICNANFSLISRDSTLRFDTLIVGAILDTTAVGLYQIAKRIGIATLRLGRPIQQAMNPELARLWARREFARFRRLVLYINGGLGLAALAGVSVTAPFMGTLVQFTFGDAFTGASSLVVVQCFAVALFLSGLLFNPAVLTMGEDRDLVKLSLSGTLLFFVTLPVFTLTFGAVGANWSHLVFNIYLRIAQLTVFNCGFRHATAPEDTR